MMALFIFSFNKTSREVRVKKMQVYISKEALRLVSLSPLEVTWYFFETVQISTQTNICCTVIIHPMQQQHCLL